MRCFAKPITGGLEKGLGAVNLQLGVFRRDFLFESIIANLSLFKRRNEVSVECGIEEVRFGKILPEGGNHSPMGREGKSLRQQQGLGDVEHRVVGSRNRKVIQPALKKNFRSLDTSLGFGQNLSNGVRHGWSVFSTHRHGFSTDIHQEGVLSIQPVMLTDRDKADKARILQAQACNHIKRSLDLFSGVSEVVEDQRHVDVRAVGPLTTSVGAEQQKSLESGAIQLFKAQTELLEDLLHGGIQHNVHHKTSLRERQREVNAARPRAAVRSET